MLGGIGAGGEGDDQGWDGWMASLTRWTWVWVNSSRWWWTGRPGVLRFRGSQRVGHDWVTELNWTEYFLNNMSTVEFDLKNNNILAKYFHMAGFLRVRTTQIWGFNCVVVGRLFTWFSLLPLIILLLIIFWRVANEEALQTAEKRREVKGKGEKERYTH